MRKKILTVDDERDILEILKAVLSRAGYEVFQALSGHEAVAPEAVNVHVEGHRSG